jgi:hypothetical protein
MRRGDRGFSLVIPTARWSGPRAHLEGSRLMVTGGGLTGNLALSGGDLPTMNLRVAPVRGGQSAQLAIAPWAADGAAITVPALHIEERGGRVAMAGQVLVSGAVPGGVVRDLDLPVAGDWTAREGLVLGRPARRCISPGRPSVRSILRRARSTCVRAMPRRARRMPCWRWAAGRCIGAPMCPACPCRARSGEALHVASGPLALGERHAQAQDIALVLGAGSDATRAHLDRLSADLGDSEGLRGTVEGGSLALAALPMNLTAFNSPWRWIDGALVMDGASLAISDRTPAAPAGGTAPDARFEPLVARGVTGRLVNNVLTAQGEVRSAGSDRVLAQVSLTHDLGHARHTGCQGACADLRQGLPARGCQQAEQGRDRRRLGRADRRRAYRLAQWAHHLRRPCLQRGLRFRQRGGPGARREGQCDLHRSAEHRHRAQPASDRGVDQPRHRGRQWRCDLRHRAQPSVARQPRGMALPQRAHVDGALRAALRRGGGAQVLARC